MWEDMSPAKDAGPIVPKAAAAPGAMRRLALGTEATTDLEADYFGIEELLADRPDPSCNTLFEIKVCWEGGEETWESERNLQEDAAPTLFAYWSGVKGGRESRMVDKELWHVFQVVSHKTKPDGNTYLKVAWVGSPDTTWEPEENIREAAVNLVEIRRQTSVLYFWARF
ncbi:putative chromo domain-containing protein [Colletotrichum sublineola]|uniref:Putative chromo domain-containing protein n=1 Tax=Colletotrichum sublineola TaxID=1173701 RepID=A0A066XSJ1_COLSU|nr:putative chromo domain-containing protein [Colletotrichum sublineola]